MSYNNGVFGGIAFHKNQSNAEFVSSMPNLKTLFFISQQKRRKK